MRNKTNSSYGVQRGFLVFYVSVNRVLEFVLKSQTDKNALHVKICNAAKFVKRMPLHTLMGENGFLSSPNHEFSLQYYYFESSDFFAIHQQSDVKPSHSNRFHK